MSLVAGLGSPLVWLHCDSPSRLEKLTALSEAVLQADEEVGVLLIYPQACPPPAEIPRRLCLPCADDGAALGRKLAAKTRIGAALIAARSLPAGVVAPLAKQGTRVLLAEMAVPRAEGFWSMTPGYKRRAFSRVSHVFLATERARALWREAGFADERLSVIGTLSQVPLALKCNETERETLAESLRHRTVWLAAGVPPEEEERVIAVQQEALRESHRLALILHPADPMRGPELYARFAHQFTMALRSRDDPITPETQVYIADSMGEMGVWLRLVPVAYPGQSLPLDGRVMTGKNPFEAVALGVLVVHGPHVANFRAAYDLLAEQGAALRVSDAKAMTDAVIAAQDPACRAPYLAGAAQVQAQVMAPLERAEQMICKMLPTDRCT
jgi:3-deoxy-D-manno-octulosonic-acid transferase